MIGLILFFSIEHYNVYCVKHLVRLFSNQITFTCLPLSLLSLMIDFFVIRC